MTKELQQAIHWVESEGLYWLVEARSGEARLFLSARHSMAFLPSYTEGGGGGAG